MRRACLVCVVGLMVVVGGCGIDTVILGSRTRELPRAEPTVAAVLVDCPTDGRGIDGLRPYGGRAVTAAPVGFVPTTVIVCAAELRPSSDDSVSLFKITVDHAPVTAALTAALQLPDLEFDPTKGDGEGGVCAADYQVKPYVLLVDADQHGYRPALPVTECGKLRPPVSTAVSGLTLTPQRTYQVRIPN